MTTLKASKRILVGSRNSLLKKEGLIPAVVYGQKTEPLNIQININEFIKAYKVVRREEVLTLDIDGKNYECKVQDVDAHPVKGLPRHVDFLLVK